MWRKKMLQTWRFPKSNFSKWIQQTNKRSSVYTVWANPAHLRAQSKVLPDLYFFRHAFFSSLPLYSAAKTSQSGRAAAGSPLHLLLIIPLILSLFLPLFTSSSPLLHGDSGSSPSQLYFFSQAEKSTLIISSFFSTALCTQDDLFSN